MNNIVRLDAFADVRKELAETLARWMTEADEAAPEIAPLPAVKSGRRKIRIR
ncbi:hypothetical protein [Paenibacillus sp. GYB003]|uniref:hypothetical protein n=1 Tax=Paenibacillus sp. GYB003 TaxID=2994392 RepID=UPI002F967488